MKKGKWTAAVRGTHSLPTGVRAPSRAYASPARTDGSPPSGTLILLSFPKELARRKDCFGEAAGSSGLSIVVFISLFSSLNTGHFLLPHHRNKQIRDARRADLTERGELATIDMIEQHDAAPEHLALVDRIKRPRSIGMIG